MGSEVSRREDNFLKVRILKEILSMNGGIINLEDVIGANKSF